MLAMVAGMALAAATADASVAREVISLDGPWQFQLGDIVGAEQPGFDDTQ